MKFVVVFFFFSVESSDEDLFTVPDVEAPPPMNSSGMTNLFGHKEHDQKNAEIQRQIGLSVKRRRGRNPADKEYRRLKRYIYISNLNICRDSAPD